jgi:hypothetical protein
MSRVLADKECNMGLRNLENYTMRLLALSMLVLLVPGTAAARCESFNFFESISEIPFIIHGKVTWSNKQDILSAQCNPDVCEHRFDIKVIETLKGNITGEKLHVNYSFVQQRPNIILFSEGEEYIFAISKVTLEGQATLFGTTCDRSGLRVEYIDRIKKALAIK